MRNKKNKVNRIEISKREEKVAKRRKYKKVKRVLINLAIVTLLVVIGITSYNIYIKYKNEKEYTDSHKELTLQLEKDYLRKTYNINPVKEEEYEEVKLLKELSQKNEDIIGFISIDNTNIKYPIVQGQDNDYYLNNNYEKVSSDSGSIFLDCKNSSDFNDVNSILYGHNMKNGSMFADLLKYRNSEFLKEQPYIKIFLKDRVLKYEIFSVYVTEADYDYRTKNFNGENDINAFLNRITCKNELSTLIEPKIGDKILTLSTCAFDFDDARLAVHAVLR